MPNSSGTYLKVTAAALQEATLKGLVSPIEAHSCDLHILHAIQDSKQVACMTQEDLASGQRCRPCPKSSYC